MASRRARRGGQRQALIRYGCVFFLSDDLSDAKPIPEEDREEFAFGVALVHYSMNASIKKFKEKSEAGVTKELTQMHNMNVFRPIEVESLTYNEKKKALSSLMFLKEKRDSSVKVRMCADGRKQKDGTWAKQDTTSPTVATESVFITAIIDAHKGRDVACFDIPGAFLHADVDEDITMVLKAQGQNGRANGAGCAKSVHNIHHSRQKGDSHTLRQDAEGSIWASEECLALLQ